MNPGDVYATTASGGKYLISKVLVVDSGPKGTLLHTMQYGKMSYVPALDDVPNLKVKAAHTAIVPSRDGKEIPIGTLPVKPEELGGYYAYLHVTDFPRFCRETGKDYERLLAEARTQFNSGNFFTEKGQVPEAIRSYSTAIDIFPQFTEALDSRGLARMEAGDLEGAKADFKASLVVAKDNSVAFLGLCECHLRMGDCNLAESLFEEGAQRWPNEMSFASGLVRAREQKARAERPWWKFW